VVNTSEDEDAIVDIASPSKDVGGGKALRRRLSRRVTSLKPTRLPLDSGLTKSQAESLMLPGGS